MLLVKPLPKSFKGLIVTPVWLFSVWVPVVLGAALRMIRLGSESLWYDESFTAWIAKLPLDRVIRAAAGDVHPPTWYLLEALNVRLLGSSEWALRFPAAVFSILVVWLVYQIAVTLFPDRGRVAWVAAMMAAIMPSGLYYAQEARVYSALAAVVLLMIYAGLTERWLWFGGAAVATLYAHNLGAFYVAGIGLYFFYRAVRQRRLSTAFRLMGIGVASGGLWLPWAVMMLKQAGAMGGGFWMAPLTVGGVLMPLPTMTMGTRVQPYLLILLWIVAFLITLWGCWSGRKWLRGRGGVVLVACFGVPLMVAGVSALWRSVYLARAFLPSAYLILIIWAYGLLTICGRNRRVYAALLIPCLLLGLVGHYFPFNGRLSADEYIKAIHAGWQDGDEVIYTSVASTIFFTYYLPEFPYTMQTGVNDLNQSIVGDARVAFGFNEGDVFSLPAKRLWFIRASTFGNSESEMKMDQRLMAAGRLIVSWRTGDNNTELWLIEHPETL